ncbi:hypothetical protein T11_99, partial [Trichinella zimbabwensis]
MGFGPTFWTTQVWLHFFCGTANIQSGTPRYHTEEDSFSWDMGRILWKAFFRNMRQLCHNHCLTELEKRLKVCSSKSHPAGTSVEFYLLNYYGTKILDMGSIDKSTISCPICVDALSNLQQAAFGKIKML